MVLAIRMECWRRKRSLYDTVPSVNRQSPETRTWRRVWPAAGLLLAGCASSPSSTPGASDLNRALDDYRAGRYDASAEAALRMQADAQLGGDAAYLAGLCAYEVGDLEGARDRLRVAADAPGPVTAARARAALGLVLLELERPGEAADHLARAATGLTGEDARQAALHAADAYRLAGDLDAAASWLRSAGDRARSGSQTGFTLQAGAYRQRPRAERAALEAAELAEGHGLAPVRVVSHTDGRGETLYLVHVGRFGSRIEAVDARRRLGRLHFVVTAVPRS